MNMALPTVSLIRLHISLNVTDLDRSIAFYEAMLGTAPAKQRSDYAKFETLEPPLVLSLEPSGRSGPGTLNHLGIRLPDARQLVAAQERLEQAGIRSQREEGVECCYARQTKFWIHDPDNTLWEFYTLDDDALAHRGSGQSAEIMMSSTVSEPEEVWEHLLGSPLSPLQSVADGSIDEVRLCGSFNVPMTADERLQLLSGAQRVLKPRGRLLVRILAGEREHPNPNLTGPAAPVRLVPAKNAVVASISDAGFSGIRLLKYPIDPCFVVDGIAMRETHIEAFRN